MDKLVGFGILIACSTLLTALFLRAMKADRKKIKALEDLAEKLGAALKKAEAKHENCLAALKTAREETSRVLDRQSLLEVLKNKFITKELVLSKLAEMGKHVGDLEKEFNKARQSGDAQETERKGETLRAAQASFFAALEVASKLGFAHTPKYKDLTQTIH